MHMAQMSTNILPKSCSHPILCVRAKGCGRAWKEGKWVEDGSEEGRSGASPEGTTHAHMLNPEAVPEASTKPGILRSG